MIPIKVKQFPNFLKDLRIRRKILSRPAPTDRVFHLCYFSCESYFQYLYCAIHSVLNNIEGERCRIYVFSDTDMPISERQIGVLHDLYSDVEVIPWPKSMGWGAEQIGNIWDAYAYVAAHAGDDDIIARIDSDVFFFNRRIFDVVSRSDADLTGDGHFVDFRFTQGGCYFFKAGAIRKVLALIEECGMNELVRDLQPVVEDVAAYSFSRRLNFKIHMTWFMVFPQEIKNLGSINRWIRYKFSCAHFVMKNKDAMLETYRKDVLGSEESRVFFGELDRVL